MRVLMEDIIPRLEAGCGDVQASLVMRALDLRQG